MAMKLGNEYIYNGYNYERDKGGSIIRTSIMTGEKLTIPKEQITADAAAEMLGQYMGMPAEERLKRSMSGDEFRQIRSAEAIAKNREIWEGPGGQIIFRIPGGMITEPTTGKLITDDIFLDARNMRISLDQVKGFKPIDVADKQAGITQKRAAATANYAQAEKSRRPDIVDPSALVSDKGGQAGLIMSDNKGKAQFNKVEGVPGGLKMPGVKPSDQKAEYALKKERLNTALEPFKNYAKNFMNFVETGDEEVDRDNAISKAIELLQKPQDAITPQEKAILPYATQAVQIYQRIIEEDAGAFGLPTGKQSQIGGVTPPPPQGFVIRGQQ